MMPPTIDLIQEFARDEQTVLEKFGAWCSSSGERDFFYYGEQDRKFTYSEFDLYTNRIGNALKSLGVEKGDRVSLLTKNGLVAISAMLGIWKCGALYCPINNRITGDLLAYVVNDTRPTLLIVDQSSLQSVNDIADQLIDHPRIVIHQPNRDDHDYDAAGAGNSPLSAFEANTFNDLICGDARPLSLAVGAQDFSSIIYTSGTTGHPKGVVHRHAWLHNLSLPLSLMTHPDDVLYCDLPMYHIGGAFSNVVRALWSGASIGVWDRFSPKDFWPRIHKTGASITILLDVMCDWIMEQPEKPTDRENPIIRAHMQPLPDHHYAMSRRFGFDFAAVGYGSTELGIGFTGLVDEFAGTQGTPDHLWKGYSRQEIIDRVVGLTGSAAVVDGATDVPKGFMGMPLGLYEPAVVGNDGTPVTLDEAGQLAMRPKLPDILFAEYFNKPVETSEAVRDGQFFPSDIVSFDTHGAFYFKDRKQGFIRVRGENVAATVIESELNKHEKISHSAAFAVPAEQGSEDDIAAFVVPREGSVLTTADLHAWCAKSMAKFMRPKHIRIADSLPVTPTMKIEKYKLRETLLQELQDCG